MMTDAVAESRARSKEGFSCPKPRVSCEHDLSRAGALARSTRRGGSLVTVFAQLQLPSLFWSQRCRCAECQRCEQQTREILSDAIFPSLLLRSEEHTSELQSRVDLVCRLLLEKKKKQKHH